MLPKQALRTAGLVIILDGVDEVENITDFTNKLRAYIDEHETKLKKYKIRFIISCRTNVYRKYIKQVAAFNEYYLNEVAFSQAAPFLFEKFGLDLSTQPNFDYSQQRQLFENPFYLELIGKYYLQHKSLRTDKATLIREFVNSRLKHDEDNKFSNDAGFDIDRIISDTRRAAFTFESLQKTNLSAADLKKVTGMEATTLAKNPFLEENTDGTWAFENKNIQEYFVATLMVELSFEEILELIRIDTDINKVHPSWYNVVSFTLNLNLPQQVYADLADWLAEHDYEVLFNADANLISDDIKERLLVRYFERHCEQETLWINDAGQIARFSQTEANITYLLKKIADESIHRRARMSAVKILSLMEPAHHHNESVKTLVKQVLSADYMDEDYIYLKEDIIMLSKSLGLSDDREFFGELIEIVREDDHKEVVGAVLRAVPEATVENHLDYFLGILDKALGLKQWKFTARTRSINSTKDTLFEHFCRITNPDKLLRIYRFLLARHKENSLKESVLKDFLEHMENVFKDRPEYNDTLTDMISKAVINDNIRYYEDDLLVNLVKACAIARPVATAVLKAVKGNSSTKHFLVEIMEEKDFIMITEQYHSGSVNDDFIREYRNVLSYRSFTLSKRFEEFVEQHSSYLFLDKLSIGEADQWAMVRSTDKQEDFNLLFNREGLLGQINYMYGYLGKDTMTNKDLETVYRKYYHDLDLFKAVRSNAKHLLGQMIRRKKGMKLSDAPKRLAAMETDIMFDIYQALPKKDEKNQKIEVSQMQVKYIENWCVNTADNLREFYKSRLIEDKELRYTEEFKVYELIHNFQKYFRFPLDKETLLNFLYFKLWEGINIQLSGQANPSENLTSDGLTNEEIGQRVVWNLVHAQLPASCFYGHLSYCLDHDIDIMSLNINFLDIIYRYLDYGSEVTAIQLIKRLYENDDNVLDELMHYQGDSRVRRMVYDTIIDIWSKSEKNDKIRTFLLQNERELIDNQVYDEIDIIRHMVGCNDPNAFKSLLGYITARLKEKKIVTIQFRNDDWQRYSNVEGIDDLVALMELYLTTPDSKAIYDRFTLPTRIASEALINICKNYDAATCTVVIERLSKMDFRKINATGGDLFYYHRLKNDIMEIYYKHKSKAYSLREVIGLLDGNRHLFIP
ncbi:hypothetical protein GCM10007424_00100 [Flavobacterium suaedae]|uniref:NACHT domain-containing protein n=1 Tax=Flavobacterium suaedae TaxID=1767027 RepID=A0ABQ1JD05_9FLAO|nr:hypothetical protein GCM10007424_00100 [Flavobacterium suaedae]